MCFVWFSLQTGIISLKSINRLIFVILTCFLRGTDWILKHYLHELHMVYRQLRRQLMKTVATHGWPAHYRIMFCDSRRCVKIINEANDVQVRGYHILFFAGLPASGSQYASGRSCDRPSRHRFPCSSSVFKRMLRWFPSYKLLLACFSCSPPNLNWSKFNPPPPSMEATKLLNFQIKIFVFNNRKIKIPRSLLSSFCHHPKAFIFTLFLR
jgi:hypothetical protein